MASPEERLALLEQRLAVVTHQLLMMQLQNAELAAAVCPQGAPQARVAPRHSSSNVGMTFGVPANFGDSKPEEKDGSATASDARVGAPGPRPGNRRSKKLRDRSHRRAERDAAATAAQESVSESDTRCGDRNPRTCAHCHGTGFVVTNRWARAAGERVRESANVLDAGSTAQRAAGSAATEPMQIAVNDLSMEGLFITSLSVGDERAVPLRATPPEKWATAMGALSPSRARSAIASITVAAPRSETSSQSDLPYQPWPEDVTSFGRQASQP